jgi:hypothetical protein
MRRHSCILKKSEKKYSCYIDNAYNVFNSLKSKLNPFFWKPYLLEVCKSDPKSIRIQSDPIRSDFGTKIFISDRINKVVS